MTLVTRRILGLAAAAIATAALTAGALIANSAQAAVTNGAKAPNFTLTDSNGNSRQLSEFAGKTVVLEWTNDGCPFVKKHYAGNIQSLQKAAAADNVVWLSIISSAPGKQGYVDGAGANKLSKDRGATPAAVLLDPMGSVGKLYGAKTTPHMYIVSAQGNLVYQGGIDDKATASVGDIPGAKNYVKLALADIKAGKPVAIASSQPYGCSVKYAE